LTRTPLPLLPVIAFVAVLVAAAPAWPQSAPDVAPLPLTPPPPVPVQMPPAQPPAPLAAPRPKVVPLDIVLPAADRSPARLPSRNESPVIGPASSATVLGNRLPSAAGSGGQVIPYAIEQVRRRAQAAQSVADVAVQTVLTLGLNKTLPLDLPVDARDVVIGDPTTADVLVRAPRQVFLMGRKIGDTNVFFLDRKGGLIRRVEVHVGPDAEGAQAAVRLVLPDDDITVTTVGDALLLSGKVRSAQVVSTARSIARRFVPSDANVLNQMIVQGAQQVLLRVRVAEVSRTLMKELGMQTGMARTYDTTHAFDITGGALDKANTSITGTLTPTAAAAAATGTTSSIAQYGTVFWGPLSSQITALEKEGLVKTLAEPNLSALSGETARLLAGGEVPIPTSQTNGAIAVEYKPFGIGLVFSPVILSNGRISLKVQTEVSAIDQPNFINVAGLTLPSFKVRRAETDIELPSGGSLMIAGLLQNDDTSNLASVPGVRDIPIFSALLGSTAFQRNETELMVTVVAYVVEPVDNKTLNLPTDGFIPASDLRQYFLMKIQTNYVGKKLDLPPSALQGPVGYIVE